MSCIITQKKKKYSSIIYPLYIYWVVLVLMQNFTGSLAESGIMLAVKAGLIGYLVYSFFKRDVIFRSKNILVWILFTGYAIINFALYEEGVNGKALIHYYFPIIFTFLVFVCGVDTKIQRRDYYKFLKLVIATVTYFSLYSVIFRFGKFTGFLSLSSTYGNELSAFFTSNHEYGMYLVFGITSVMICYQTTRKKRVRFGYLCLLALFAVNLLATLSRTSYLACVVIVSVFLFLSKNHKIKKWFLIVIAIMLIIVILIPQMRNFVDLLIFKENNDAGRFDMWDIAFDDFKHFPLYKQLIGSGYTNINHYIGTYFQHETVHNMFLQVILVWGVIGVLTIAMVLFHSIRNAIRIYRKDRNLSVIFLALSFSAIAFMTTNTACLMQSPIDSYMLTIFTVIIPKYVSNSVVEAKPKKRRIRVNPSGNSVLRRQR